MKHKSELLQKAQECVFSLFKEKLSPKFLYHNYRHTLEVVNTCQEIGDKYDLDKEQMETLLLAAWFHDVGYAETYHGHEDKSIVTAQSFLRENNFSEERINKVCELILSTSVNRKPATVLEEIMHDADYINIGKKSFFEKAELLRTEWEVFLGKFYTDLEWAQLQLDFLLNNNFVTEYAQKEYGGQRGKNIETQRKRMDKIKQGGSNSERRRSKLGRGVETMYRATYRNHIELSAIADNKANMMISINTIIMSVIISLFGSGITFVGTGYFEHLRFALPMCILLLTSLSSVIFAVLSAKPTVTSKKAEAQGDLKAQKEAERKTSLLFFGNFSEVPIESFIENMDRLKSNQEELYESMSIDIYYLGKVLKQKYHLLRYSYLIFMGGLILSVMVFMVVFLLSYKKV